MNLNNMIQKYDIVIPAVAGDVPFLPKVIKYIRINLLDAETIYIVTNRNNFKHKALKNIKDFGGVLLDENEFISGLSFKCIEENLVSRHYYNNPGWFLQQFIKLGFAQTPYAKDYYLTWDADTLPLSKICFFENQHPLFTIKKEYHKAYFETIQNLFGYSKVVDYSFIAEHMMFKVSVVREMLEKIGHGGGEDKKWFEKCLDACNFDSKYPAPHFSEFETYGTYCFMNYPELYHTQKLNTFRSAGFIRGRFINDKILSKMALDLDTASFELYDRPVFPYSVPYYWDYYKKKIRKASRMSFLNILQKLIHLV